jgi:glycosyltransferase involved in cell wall biosynthesis
MRILHLDSGKEMRGGQWQVLRLIQGLADEGVDSTLLARAGAPLFVAARQSGIRVEPLSFARAAVLGRRHDIIHAHDAHSHSTAALSVGAPLVVSRRVAFPPARTAASRWKYARPARYIAVSEFVKRVLIESGVPAAKIDVVYDGVPVGQSSPPESCAGQVACSTALAPSNADDPEKGASLAADAARLAGVDLKLSTDLVRDLPGSFMFLYLTYSEGLGSAALLAMSAGVPVIASKVGGLPEIVRPGETGFLVENTAESAAAAIRELCENPALAAQIGRAGRQAVIERFTVGHTVRHTIEVYRQALS